ncbi:MAG: SDR family NAD(P)-dependent oxidoreductase [Thermomicrobiales bacterium]
MTVSQASMPRRHEGAVAFITGGGRGIGRAIAERLSADGASVALIARTPAELNTTTSAIRANGGNAIAIQADIADPLQIEAAIAQAEASLGPISILVNNAAISPLTDLVQGSFEQWEAVIQVNLFGAVHCARFVGRSMIDRAAGGAIINISSIHGTRVESHASAYDIAKGGIDQLTRSLAMELAPHGIRVNAVAPGFIDTAMSIGADGISEVETSEFRQIYVDGRRIPVGRAGQPSEIASVVSFLASDDASYISGAIIPVDGGLSTTF